MEIAILGIILLALAASPFVLLVLHLAARDRIRRLERAIKDLGDGYESRLRDLESRIGLPASGRDAAESASAASPAPAEPSIVSPTPSPAPPPIPPRAATRSPRAMAGGSGFAAGSSRSSAEWEELIGGSWVNKIGVVVTVIGIALALGYSMRTLGPAGRVGLALAMSGAMLVGGALLEDRERYRIFARGLIGGGWAGLYFTTFAMHGLEAARIVDSPLVATVLLVAVSVGMVLHSLLYRSQTVTALAYFVTFATLAIVPLSRFALFASLPAAASLLYVGRRFRWKHMVVAGVALTYGVHLMRGGSPDVRPEDWAFGQALLFVYWTLFELFDLLSLRAREEGGVEETLMPLNAAGLVGTSVLGWSEVRPGSVWVFFVVAAGLFAASAAIRALRAPAREADETDFIGRLRGGGYEAALLFAAVMLLFGIGSGFDGWRERVGWMLEAQLLVLGGLALRDPFLRHLGSAVLAVPVAALLADDLPSGGTLVALGRSWWRSTPLALVTAGVLYVDRALIRRADGARAAGLEHLYSGIGTLVVAVVLANELPDLWVAPAWFALGTGIVAFSLTRGASELFVQGYVVAAFSWLVMTLGNVPTDDLVWGWPARWVTALPMIVVLYALAYARRGADASPATSAEAAGGAGTADTAVTDGRRVAAEPARMRGIEAVADYLDRGAAATMFLAATLLLSWFLLFEVSGRWLTVAWGLQGASLLLAGFALRERRVRVSGLVVLMACVGKLFLYDAAELETIFRIFSFIILGALLLAVSFAYSRYREQIRRLL